MPHVSKKQIKKETAQKIREHFIKTVVSLGGKNQGKVFIGEILTSTEQIMLAKRLAMLIMLADGVSSYKVCKILNLSASTSARFKKEVDGGAYPYIKSIVEKKKSKDKIWNELEVLLRGGLPSMGKDRWKWLDEFMQK